MRAFELAVWIFFRIFAMRARQRKRQRNWKGMYTKMFLDTQAANALGTGTRGAVFILFGGEIGAMLLDMRWGVMLLVLLVVADFRYGWGESAKRYKAAQREGNAILMEHYRWHTSRAVRRTLNKLADYIVIMLMCGAVGMAIFEPLGIEHTWGAWIGAVIACGCEVISIFGHFFYLHGIHVEARSLKDFLKTLAVAITRRKVDPDIGDALGEAFDSTGESKNAKGKSDDIRDY